MSVIIASNLDLRHQIIDRLLFPAVFFPKVLTILFICIFFPYSLLLTPRTFLVLFPYQFPLVSLYLSPSFSLSVPYFLTSLTSSSIPGLCENLSFHCSFWTDLIFKSRLSNCWMFNSLCFQYLVEQSRVIFKVNLPHSLTVVFCKYWRCISKFASPNSQTCISKSRHRTVLKEHWSERWRTKIRIS